MWLVKEAGKLVTDKNYDEDEAASRQQHKVLPPSLRAPATMSNHIPRLLLHEAYVAPWWRRPAWDICMERPPPDLLRARSAEHSSSRVCLKQEGHGGPDRHVHLEEADDQRLLLRVVRRPEHGVTSPWPVAVCVHRVSTEQASTDSSVHSSQCPDRTG